jgi:hypothetical protein
VSVLRPPGKVLWANWFNSTSPQTVPSGLLHWNQSYTLTGCGWDGSDPFAVYPNGGVSCNAWTITPTNAAPPTPPQLSPVAGTVITTTSSATLVAGAVSDPDGDNPVSSSFQVFNNPTASGSPIAQSPAPVASTSWPTGTLPDGTYYWGVQASDTTGDPSGVSPWSPVLSQFIIDNPAPPTPAPQTSSATPPPPR